MNKHSAGPWEWTGPNTLWGGERGVEEVLKAADDGKPYGLHSALIEHHWDADTARANRALMASAPDLLDALKYARRMVNPQEVDIAFIDAAIAKALGEQP